jgi:hypothetical protein
VISAFINAIRPLLSSPVFCYLPDGFKQPGIVVAVDRALYGLRDSPSLWYKDLTHTFTTKCGLVKCKEEPCLFMDKEKKVFVVFHVDDIIVLYHKNDERLGQQVEAALNSAYALHPLGDLSWFLGIRVIRDREARKLFLVHDTYLERIAKKFDLVGGKTPSTPLPMLELEKNTAVATATQVKEYQEKVGSVLYTAVMTRPDVAFAAARLSRFLTNPSKEHLEAVNWTIKYLFATRFLAIMYSAQQQDTQLIVSSDASFADDAETRRSSQGFCISLFGGLVQWAASRQATVTTSTTEAELLSVERTAKESMAMGRFFKEIGLNLGEAWNIFCDNQQTIRLIVGENERIVTKLRHIDIQNMWLRQEHAIGSFVVSYLPTNDMPADGFTKNLSRPKFEHFRALLNMQDARNLVEKLDV